MLLILWGNMPYNLRFKKKIESRLFGMEEV